MSEAHVTTVGRLQQLVPDEENGTTRETDWVYRQHRFWSTIKIFVVRMLQPQRSTVSTAGPHGLV